MMPSEKYFQTAFLRPKQSMPLTVSQSPPPRLLLSSYLKPTRSVRDSSAGRLTVGSGRSIRGCFRRPPGEAMAGHYHLMREVVGIQG